MIFCREYDIVNPMDFSYVRQDTVSSASAAARAGDLARLRQLVAEAGPGDRGWLQVDNRGWGPLHHAASLGHAEVVAFLGSLDTVSVDSRTWEGETALFLACRNLPAAQAAVHALLKLHADVNITTNERCSPLQYAAVRSYQSMSLIKCDPINVR